MEINPEQERQRLTERYAGMPLEKLQKIAADWDGLTDIAREILEAQIKGRGASISDSINTSKSVVPQPVLEQPIHEENNDLPVEMEPDNSSGTNLVMIRRFRDFPEALLARGAVEAAGIECFLADENMVRLDWFISNLLGGVKLLVRSE